MGEVLGLVGKAPLPMEKADLMHKEAREWRDTGKEELSDLARNPGAHWGAHPPRVRSSYSFHSGRMPRPITVCVGGPGRFPYTGHQVPVHRVMGAGGRKRRKLAVKQW